MKKFIFSIFLIMGLSLCIPQLGYSAKASNLSMVILDKKPDKPKPQEPQKPQEPKKPQRDTITTIGNDVIFRGKVIHKITDASKSDSTKTN